jgi:hypothetical protein
MPTDKQVNYAIMLLGRAGYSTDYMDCRFAELGATMRQRCGTVERWLRAMSAAKISDLIDTLIESSRRQKPLAFISYDSSDQDFVRLLVAELAKRMCPVWMDELSLEVGDSLRERIERGIMEAPKCILVLSPDFLANHGWCRAEFDSIYIREILEKRNVILPIWHRVAVHDVYAYSPRLADRVALDSSIGVEELADKLSRALRDRSSAVTSGTANALV